jgi:hypothetical protein
MQNMQDMTDSEMEDRLDCVLLDLAEIKAQIEHAKGVALQDGTYADAHWFARATRALRVKGAVHQLLLRELARRKKEERRRYNARLERIFIDVARMHLDDGTFKRIMNEAASRADHTTVYSEVNSENAG